MSVVVCFSDQNVWLVAGWAFRRLKDDITRKCPDDPYVAYTLEEAEALSGLIIYLIEENDIKEKIIDAMKLAVEEIINDHGKELRRGLDEDGYDMYREALPELLGYILRYQNEVASTE